jgi:type III secretory pathway lipoprotein EscJ
MIQHNLSESTVGDSKRSDVVVKGFASLKHESLLIVFDQKRGSARRSVSAAALDASFVRASTMMMIKSCVRCFELVVGWLIG